MRKYAILLIALLYTVPAFAQQKDIEKIPIEVSAKANLYFHEVRDTSIVPGGAGIPPVAIDIRGVKMVTFEDAQGLVTWFEHEGDSAYCDADGSTLGNTDIGETGPIAGITHKKKIMFLTGVMVSEYSGLEEPFPKMDFTEKEYDTEFDLPFNQTFFIGDGKGKGGATQRFMVRPDATVMYIGFADCFTNGPSRNYRDNKGSIKITVVLHRKAEVRN
jgi:hypothetical protein